MKLIVRKLSYIFVLLTSFSSIVVLRFSTFLMCSVQGYVWCTLISFDYVLHLFYYEILWFRYLVVWNEAKWNQLSESYHSIIIQTYNFFVNSLMFKQVIATVLTTRLIVNQCKIKLIVSVIQQIISQTHFYTCFFIIFFHVLNKKTY